MGEICGNIEGRRPLWVQEEPENMGVALCEAVLWGAAFRPAPAGWNFATGVGLSGRRLERGHRLEQQELLSRAIGDD